MDTEDLLYVVEFKASRREFYANPFSLELIESSWVIVEAERGEDMGLVHRILQQHENVGPRPAKPHIILREAIYDDHEKLAKNRDMEKESLENCKKLVGQYGLSMKLVDAEYQYDCNKMTYYFTAEERVDFRNLVKELASIYRTRIELRQIGVRDEARRIGGYGICGLKQCCNTFIKEFEPISTQLARDQNLSLNPAKISGNCGRLLCCLLYEQNHYADTLKKFPDVGSTVQAPLGPAKVESVNVFQQTMSLRFEDGSFSKMTWKEFSQLEKKRRFVASLKSRS